MVITNGTARGVVALESACVLFSRSRINLMYNFDIGGDDSIVNVLMTTNCITENILIVTSGAGSPYCQLQASWEFRLTAVGW